MAQVLAAVSIKKAISWEQFFSALRSCTLEKKYIVLLAMPFCCVQSIWLLHASSLKFCSIYVVKCLLLQREINKNFVKSKHKIRCVTRGCFLNFVQLLVQGVECSFLQHRIALFIKEICLFLRYPAVTELSFLEALKIILGYLNSCNCCKCKSLFIDWVFCNCKTYKK